MKNRVVIVTSLVILFIGTARTTAAAQEWTDWQGPNGGVRIRAGLRDRDQNAQKHVAAVEVEVQNVWLNYPDVFAQPGVRVGVLQYQLDQCPKILTTDTRLQFVDLPPGDHAITVNLLDINNQLLAPAAKMTLTVP
jgi:hypothetical protein